VAARVNNEVYEDLGDRWYDADDDPIALLRAEARLHEPWIAANLRGALGDGPLRVLDLGCGAGFVANPLAARGLRVTGVDLSGGALDVARRHQTASSVRWLQADARALPLAEGSFDAVVAMDFLEHVAPIEPVIAEVARVLAPDGLFFFHTFNRNVLSWLVVIKGVEWFVRNVPPCLHVYDGFIKPNELTAACASTGLDMQRIHGCVPRLSCALLRLLATGVVPRDLEFRFTRRTATGYSGIAARRR
jgi:2-polyprenyl-6-hydroxyphenyl methylase/3-demethylubiquinone-9 3-methyltransferase